MAREVILGIDGGGTHTRAMATTTDGEVLAYIETGPASPEHTTHGQANVQQAIRDVIRQAACHVADVKYLAAGLSGLDGTTDYAWAEQYTSLPELTCPYLHVNDAVVAHTGAFDTQPGIVAIAGTGANVFALTETGQQIYSDDFAYRARVAAFHIGIDTVFHILAGDTVAEDQALVQQILNYWHVNDIDTLRAKGRSGFAADSLGRLAVMGRLAPLVTEAAQHGSPLGRLVCDRAAAALALGIRLVGGCFTMPTVPVVLTGSVARSAYMRTAVGRALNTASNPAYQIIEPTFAPVVGAVLLGIRAYRGEVTEAVVQTLRQYPQTSGT